MPPKFKFQEGEKVLCFHGPLIYEAKCLKSEFSKEDKQIKYLIHYAGWNKNWDEWVPEDRVLKFNEVNVQKQLEVQKVHAQSSASKQNRKSSGASKIQTRKSDTNREKEKDSDSRASTPVALLERTPSRASKSGSAVTPTSSSDSPLEAPRKKRGRPEPSDDVVEYHVKTDIKIPIPDDLKCYLIDECDVITKQKKLPSLPMSTTVDKIIDNYVEAIESGKIDLHIESAIEVSKGIKEYFNTSINVQLLYAWEKPQFEEMIPEDSDTQPSSLYGPYHLLRLFVKLADMLKYTLFDEKSKELLLKHFHHFLKYLSDNSSTLFNLNDYKDPLPDYRKKFSK
ncbi:mortality factor 4-like protein 1 [Phymastichus coffea]|uniref:mortality factor 4-like protein 1 n=1 Tax=Phymastichus coffea TaxID=108790 RepID=UPI00273B866C|nr:mortality factor 4-like protein 1 [Phymastichus coffea]XP_058800228.1 mortality factor 4-like protein 1 [Phymastichus coffea]XP_058800229.1 mortality factor 4-like protein 1 [Phymastichus coffea]XP_058800230.1 mortality factor 4-like protein 1 [Phymastichus coffea]